MEQNVLLTGTLHATSGLVGRLLNQTASPLTLCIIFAEESAKIQYSNQYKSHNQSSNSEPPHDESQKTLQLQLDDKQSLLLKYSCNLRDQARINAISPPHASAWLYLIKLFLIPTLVWPKHEFITAARIWRGMSFQLIQMYAGELLTSSETICLAVASTQRHDALRDII